MGRGAALGREPATAVGAEAELQESGTVYRNVSVDCGSRVQLSGTTTPKNCCVHIWMHISSFCYLQYEMAASSLPILPAQREASPLLCQRTLRVRAESRERAAAQTKA